MRETTLYVVYTRDEEPAARRMYPKHRVISLHTPKTGLRADAVIMTFTPRGDLEQMWFETVIKTALKPGGQIIWQC